MDLRDVVEEIAECVEFELGRLHELEFAAIGPICDEVCSGLRTMAGCALLLDAETESWRRHLSRSGRTRLDYLARWRREQPDSPNPYAAAGNSAALFDAVAAGDLGLARSLDRASPSTFWPGKEYEADYATAALVRLLVAAPAPAPSVLAAAVRHLRTASDGEPCAMADVCAAIGDRDQSAFDAGFAALLADRDAELASLGEPYTPYDEAAHRVALTFHVDAIALRSVASLHGLSVRYEYRFCPAMTRVDLDDRTPQE